MRAAPTCGHSSSQTTLLLPTVQPSLPCTGLPRSPPPPSPGPHCSARLHSGWPHSGPSPRPPCPQSPAPAASRCATAAAAAPVGGRSGEESESGRRASGAGMFLALPAACPQRGPAGRAMCGRAGAHVSLQPGAQQLPSLAGLSGPAPGVGPPLAMLRRRALHATCGFRPHRLSGLDPAQRGRQVRRRLPANGRLR